MYAAVRRAYNVGSGGERNGGPQARALRRYFPIVTGGWPAVHSTLVLALAGGQKTKTANSVGAGGWRMAGGLNVHLADEQPSAVGVDGADATCFDHTEFFSREAGEEAGDHRDNAFALLLIADFHSMFAPFLLLAGECVLREEVFHLSSAGRPLLETGPSFLIRLVRTEHTNWYCFRRR